MLPSKSWIFAVLIPAFAIAMAPPCTSDSDCSEGETCTNGDCIKAVKPVCPANMHFVTCGSTCHQRCGQPWPIVCNKMCFHGCVCDAGYVLDALNKCIKLEECPVPTPPPINETCPANMRFVTCGSTCHQQCGQPWPVVCNRMCFRGCVCIEGYILDAQNTCIKKEECPTPKPVPANETCPANMHFVECGSACPPSCATVGRSIPCTMQCVRGCFCDNGYVLNNEGKCVKLEECVPACPANMHFVECGSTCQEKCNEPMPPLCNLLCYRGCICDEGYILNGTNACVKREECPAPAQIVCPVNMHHEECASTCRERCNEPLPTICNKMCFNGCVCDAGYVLNQENKCIKKEECPAPNSSLPACPPNMHFSNCSSGCPERCNQPSPMACAAVCRAGCVCDDGFILDRLPNQGCIRREQCPQIQPPADLCSLIRCRAGYECLDGNCVLRRDCPMIKMAPPSSHCVYIPEVDQRGCLMPRLVCTNPPTEKREVENTCGPNSHKSNCTNFCPPIHCGNIDQKIVCFSLRCGPPGCVCDDGYIFKTSDKSLGCIKRTECAAGELVPKPAKVCGVNEHYTNCGTACEPVCGQREPTMCTMQCILDVCQCNTGFFRHPTKGCVSAADC